ncbi:thioesterase family protein [Burkholderia ubonensis]|uniref:thioesterase family protein n=1 Tax=Burkholderia ubonensis TaxID=101571 RepID=UPI001C52ED7F|nr:thioesterase family protein [Burkholderia ubonensis]
MKTFDATATPSQVLEASHSDAQIELDHSWWGFGGVHGGLALGLLTAAMQAGAEGRTLRQISGQFRRPLREPFDLCVSERSSGRSVSWFEADALESGRAAISASAVFVAPDNRDGIPGLLPVTPTMPTVPPPAQCPIFTIPPDFVPFARHTEIRPVGPARPFSGGAEPELMAWLRLVDNDLPPDEARLIVLMDSLAPSYAAVLEIPMVIPTVTFTVAPGDGLTTVTSPWVLLRARTHACRRDGWLREQLDAWAPDGAYLGSSEQLRVVRSA